MKSKTICIDFDGTIAIHKYPSVGKMVPYAKDVIVKLKAAGHTIILYTMRSDGPDGPTLTDALRFCKDNGIPIDHANINPDQSRWTNSPKVYSHLYIDDAALGCPLVKQDPGARGYVDWRAVEEWLINLGYI